MEPTRLFAIVSLVSLPTVMFGGYSLRRLLERGGSLTEFQRTYFRAGHAHAGVLLVLSLVFSDYLARTTVSEGLQWLACAVLAAGIVAQSGGFFLHMAVGEPERPSAGTTVTTAGALLLAAPVLFLAYALIAEHPG
jgi:Ni,Fe-hydrogenase I cytochrome b subunit